MSAAVLRKNAVRRPAIRSRESPVDACKTAAQAEMLQTHTGGDNPVVCVRALHRRRSMPQQTFPTSGTQGPQHFWEMLASGMLANLPVALRSHTQTQPRQKAGVRLQTSSHAGASWVSCRVFERTGGWSPRERSAQRKNAERSSTQSCEAS